MKPRRRKQQTLVVKYWELGREDKDTFMKW